MAKIKKIGDYPVNADLLAVMIYKDEFDAELIQDAIDLEAELIKDVPSIKMTKIAQMYFAIAASADESLLIDGGYTKFLKSIEISKCLNLLGDIITVIIIEAQSEPDKKEDEKTGKSQKSKSVSK